MIKDRSLTSLTHKLGRKTSILSDAEVAMAVALVRKTMTRSFGESVSSLFGEQRSEDFVRWAPMQARCEEKRAGRGLSIRDVSMMLGIPQCRLRAIEAGSCGGFKPEMARRYLEFLELGPWLKRWIQQNRELAARAGLLDETSLAPVARATPHVSAHQEKTQ